MELCGFDDAVKQQIYKLASIGLCPNVVGQVVVDLMVNPPKPGEESYELCIFLSYYYSIICTANANII